MCGGDGYSVVTMEGVGHRYFTERTCGVVGGGGRLERNNGESKKHGREVRSGQGSEISAKVDKK